MNVHYKVWLEIEEIDESRDHYQTVDTPGGALATFPTHDEACAFVERANRMLDPGRDSAGRPALGQPGGLPPPPIQSGMTLTLLHGRNGPRQTMEDWGFASQRICGVAWINLADFHILNVGFVSTQAMEAAQRQTGWRVWEDLILQTHVRDGLIEAAGCYYGDFELDTQRPEENAASQTPQHG